MQWFNKDHYVLLAAIWGDYNIAKDSIRENMYNELNKVNKSNKHFLLK